MKTHARLTSLALILAAFVCCSAEELDDLHKILRSDGPVRQKAVACKRLAVIGNAESVDILVKYLKDENLSHYARFALEAIPDRSVDKHLKASLGELSGKPLIGVISTIGNRGDRSAIGQLTPLLGEKATSAAAAVALAKINDQKAVEALVAAFDKSQPADEHLARACLLAAERWAAQDKSDTALRLYRSVRTASIAKHLKIAATRASIQQHDDSHELLAVTLGSKDDEFFDAAIQAVRDAPGLRSEAVANLLQRIYPDASPKRKELIIGLLGDMKTGECAELFKRALKEDWRLAAAALTAIGKRNEITLIDEVISATAGPNDTVRASGIKAITQLKGKGVDEALIRMNDDSLFVEVAQVRRLNGANQRLMKIWADKADLATDAIVALGMVLDSSGIELLGKRALASSDSEERKALMAALTAVCIRVPDRELAVKEAVALFGEASNRAAVYPLLREVGGKTALATIVKDARAGDDALRDEATKVLGTWLTVDVADPLLELAKSRLSRKYRVRALRGYVRVIRQFGIPLNERCEMTRRALKAAERNQEKILALQATLRFPCKEAMSLALNEMKADKMKIPAAQIAVVMAERMQSPDADFIRSSMKTVLDAGVDPALAKRTQAVIDKVSGN